MRKKDIIASVALVLVLLWMASIAYIEHIKENSERKHVEKLIDTRAYTINEISKIDQENIELDNQVYQNILSIFDRIKIISKDNPDKVRDKVIKSINLEESSLTIEASIIALLKNYQEFEEDPVVQVYLNENVKIMKKIDENNNIKDSLVDFLQKQADYCFKSSIDEGTETY